ncbi:MAG: ammonium transporter, partial [SAR324 cluster bacterium]|nr:ammonium transporter [SAR324 cluster bacterium]
TPMGALIIGLIAGVVCYLGVLMKRPLGYDDSLDVFGIHGIGGALGALLTGVLATAAYDPEATTGSLGQLGIQGVAVLATAIYAAVVTFIIVWVLKKVIGLRVTEEEEREGLDISQHGEQGYRLF